MLGRYYLIPDAWKCVISSDVEQGFFFGLFSDGSNIDKTMWQLETVMDVSECLHIHDTGRSM